MKLPPYADWLALTIEQSDAPPGLAPILAMPFSARVLGRPGFLHGGALGGLLEMAAVLALHDALGDDAARVKPVNVTIDFMRGGREKTTRAQGRVTRLGTRIANVEATAWQDDRDVAIAVARMNYRLVRG